MFRRTARIDDREATNADETAERPGAVLSGLLLGRGGPADVETLGVVDALGA